MRLMRGLVTHLVCKIEGLIGRWRVESGEFDLYLHNYP